MSENTRIPHEYLCEEDFYEDREVGSGRNNYYCDHCGESIPKGSPSIIHTFYSEFNMHRTHVKCSKPFIDSLRTKQECEEDEE